MSAVDEAPGAPHPAVAVAMAGLGATRAGGGDVYVLREEGRARLHDALSATKPAHLVEAAQALVTFAYFLDGRGHAPAAQAILDVLAEHVDAIARAGGDAAAITSAVEGALADEGRRLGRFAGEPESTTPVGARAAPEGAIKAGPGARFTLQKK